MESFEILGKQSLCIGWNICSSISEEIFNLKSTSYVFISDQNLKDSICQSLASDLACTIRYNEWKAQIHILPVSAGESSKSHHVKQDIEKRLFFHGCRRDTVIVAVGGGVIGDLSGYVAATYMRGVRIVQIPTSLLAMVDSSIGGKTGINTEFGKNLVGAIWQPEKIFIDVNYLSSLPARQIFNGLAEVIKIAAVFDCELFELLELNANIIVSAIENKLDLDVQIPIKLPRKITKPIPATLMLGEFLEKIIKSSARIKADIVTNDEREKGQRSLLNFGHTIGHAYEKFLLPDSLHGECVAFGIIKEAEVARHIGIMSAQAVNRLRNCISAYNLPVSIQNLPGASLLDIEDIMDAMTIDKKTNAKGKRIVLLNDIGELYRQEAVAVDDRILRLILSSNISVNRRKGTEFGCSPIIKVPGSKSITNRAILLAALGRGKCKLKNVLRSDDTDHLMNTMNNLGIAEFVWADGGDSLVVRGCRGQFKSFRGEHFIGNAGTAARFLTTFLTLGLPDSCTILTGDDRMKERPIGSLVKALKLNGSNITFLGSEGCLPLEIKGGGLRGGEIVLDAKISSQYVSSILLCAPYSKLATRIRIPGGDTISMPYIQMTLNMMKTFGVEVTVSKTDDLLFDIPKICYNNPAEYVIESDASSATYPLALAALMGIPCEIANIGPDSIQGDSMFAKEVLEPMGCLVTMKSDSIQVNPLPFGLLKPLGKINMENLTDSFMTAAVLASTAAKYGDGITEIVGVSNQRVKECNRIAAMVKELQKFGVDVVELDDGIKITAKPLEDMKPCSPIETYNDHRIAMSFSVLGSTLTHGTVIKNKSCVEKTWPSWWDFLSRNFSGVELSDGVSKKSTIKNISKPNSVVIIGMRGAGKSLFGRLANNFLGYQLFDLDREIEKEIKMSVRQAVEKMGWPFFRRAECSLFKKILSENSSQAVIVCGGGIVELQENRALLQQASNAGLTVLHLSRSIDDIILELNNSVERPDLDYDSLIKWNQRKDWYSECSNFELFIPRLEGPRLYSTLSDAIESFWTMKPGSLSDSFHDMFSLRIREDYLDGLSENEVQGFSRVEVFFKDVALKNSILQSKVYEILGNLRAFKKNLSIDISNLSINDPAFLPLLKAILKSDADYVSIPFNKNSKILHELRNTRAKVRPVMKFEKVDTPIKAWSNVLLDHLRRIHSTNVAFDICFQASGRTSDLADLIKFRETTKFSDVTANIDGPQAIISLLFENRLTTLQYGQMTIQEVNKLRYQLGIRTKKNFCVIGRNIMYSKSPVLHSGQFSQFNLPHHFKILDCDDISKVESFIRAPDFGGASVTMPYKTEIIDLVDEVSQDVRQIGAMNTIVVDSRNDGRLIGENTDWQAIYAKVNGVNFKDRCALVIGCGGTSKAAIYALHRAKFSPIYVLNRSEESWMEIKTHYVNFDLRFFEDTATLDGKALDVIVSTIPANRSLDPTLKERVHCAFSKGGELFIDMAYDPPETYLMKLAQQMEWKQIFNGLELLIDQGKIQFKFWTGLEADDHRARQDILSYDV